MTPPLAALSAERPPPAPTVAYLAPLRAAWQRAREILFRPVKARTWLVLGFAAWLAGLMEGTGGGHVGVEPFHVLRSGPNSIHQFWQRLSENPWFGAIVVAGAVTVAAVLLFLLYISSRAKFVFLDCAINRRAAIVEPWRRTRLPGVSLFRWRLGFFAVALAAGATLVSLFVTAAGGIDRFGFASTRAALITSLGVVTILLFVTAVALVALFLDSFVVPLMIRGNLTTSAAWAAFLPWLEAHFGAFVLYAMFVLVLWTCVGLAVVAAGLATCCTVPFILAVPYLGTVALLPVHVTFRLFSLAFWSQFDPAFDVASFRPLPYDPVADSNHATSRLSSSSSNSPR